MDSTGRFTPELRRLVADSYDACRSCGAQIAREQPAYAGYDEQRRAIYVGPCCLSSVAELASHIYWWWEADKRCAPETLLWRYMDFAKFVALIQQQALFFARLDRLGDAYEGAMGITDRLPQWEKFYLDFFREAIATTPGRESSPTEEELERESTRLLGDIRAIGERERRTQFASCWHANSVESEAQWRLYCPPPSFGVAILTSAKSLIESLDPSVSVKLGRVQYTDFRSSFAGFHDRAFWKRKSLSHEMEVRGVIKQHDPEDVSGISVAVDLTALIQAVIPSPFAPGWLQSVIEGTLDRFGVALPVRTSELLLEPFF